MRGRRLVLAALTAALPAWPEQDWELLFDGHTTTNWVEVSGRPFPTDTWSIEDGCLHVVPSKDAFQDIRTVAKFTSFELEWEWRIAKDGNSGVKYLLLGIDTWANRTGKGTHARARGFEYQLADDAGPLEGIYRAGSLYGVLAPARRVSHAAGEFNQSRLVVRGGHGEHWLNGLKVVAFEMDDPQVVASFEKSTKRKLPGTVAWESYISLQHHNSEAWFRNIRIRRLP